jgi:hypothetical protein
MFWGKLEVFEGFSLALTKSPVLWFSDSRKLGDNSVPWIPFLQLSRSEASTGVALGETLVFTDGDDLTLTSRSLRTREWTLPGPRVHRDSMTLPGPRGTLHKVANISRELGELLTAGIPRQDQPRRREVQIFS